MGKEMKKKDILSKLYENLSLNHRSVVFVRSSLFPPHFIFLFVSLLFLQIFPYFSFSISFSFISSLLFSSLLFSSLLFSSLLFSTLLLCFLPLLSFPLLSYSSSTLLLSLSLSPYHPLLSIYSPISSSSKVASCISRAQPFPTPLSNLLGRVSPE